MNDKPTITRNPPVTYKGHPEHPGARPVVRASMESAEIELPGLGETPHPLEVVFDYYGRTPHFQVLCYDHDNEQGEPKVVVRYNRQGKIQEVLVDGRDILVLGNFDLTRVNMPTDTSDTEWEKARDANPPCEAGDMLRMPSGLVAKVTRLRDRYDGSFQEFVNYDGVYNLAERLGYPDANAAWAKNPLTAGTTNPDDFSAVPELASLEETE